MRLSISIDHTTLEFTARGKSGRAYSTDEVSRAQAARKHPGRDPEGERWADDLDRDDLADMSPRDQLRQVMDDCPECQAARARGEVPQYFSTDELLGEERRARRKKPTIRRWRTMKRRAG